MQQHEGFNTKNITEGIARKYFQRSKDFSKHILKILVEDRL